MSLTVEDLGRAGLKLWQDSEGYRYGTDTVLLAWFASSFVRRSRRRASMLELGSGNGAGALLVAGRIPEADIDAVEINPSSYELLKKNIDGNGLAGRITPYNADIRDLPQEIRSKQYDVVFFNPPYYNVMNGPASKRTGSGGARLGGRFEENGDLTDFVKAAASRAVQSSGHIVMVMQGQRLPDTMTALAGCGIKPVALMSVHPLADRNASVFLISGKKGGSGTDMKILPPLILAERTGSGNDIIETKRVLDIYSKEHEDCFI